MTYGRVADRMTARQIQAIFLNRTTRTLATLRKRKVVLALMLGGVVALGLTLLIVLRRGIVERWYTWMLESEDYNTRRAAAERLWQMGSTESVPFKIRDLIVDRQWPARSRNTLTVQFIGNRLFIDTPCMVDLEYANGHEAYLSFIRCRIQSKYVDIEKVVWQGKTISRSDVSGRVLRTRIDGDRFERVLEAVRLLPTIVVEYDSARSDSSANRQDRSMPSVGTAWTSTTNFFTLVRITDESNKVVLERQYAGYEDSASWRSYVPVLVLREITDEVLSKNGPWESVPEDLWRQSHFSEAFILNGALMTDGHYWFVMEQSVEALAWFGNTAVIPTLQDLRGETGTIERKAAKIDAVLSRPDCWLQGKPKVLDLTECR